MVCLSKSLSYGFFHVSQDRLRQFNVLCSADLSTDLYSVHKDLAPGHDLVAQTLVCSAQDILASSPDLWLFIGNYITS